MDVLYIELGNSNIVELVVHIKVLLRVIVKTLRMSTFRPIVRRASWSFRLPTVKRFMCKILYNKGNFSDLS